MTEPSAQTVSTIGVFGLTVLLAVLGWAQNHAMMRHGLFAAATWTGGVFTMRILNAVGIGNMESARAFNGWFSWVVIAVLVALWVSEWWASRAAKR